MMMAIFMLLMLSGIGVLAIKYASIHAKHFADSFIKEQAQLFKDSVIETTLLKIEGIDRRGGQCPKKFDFISPDGRFEANVTILHYYLYNGKDNDGSSSCANAIAIKTPESHGYVEMEVVVSTRAGAKVQNPIRIYDRSLQRP